MSTLPNHPPSPLVSESDFVFVPLGELTSPAGGVYFQHYVKCWWIVHPEKGAAFYNPRKTNGRRRHSLPGIPQCNSSQQIAESIVRKRHPGAEVHLIESAWVPININDYMM